MSEIVWDLQWEKGEWPLASWVRWKSSCGRYRVYRTISREGSLPKFAGVSVTKSRNGKDIESITEAEIAMGPGYPRYFSTLEGALISVEKYHARVEKLEVAASNRQYLVLLATTQGLAGQDVSTAEKQSKSKKTPEPITDRFGFLLSSKEARANAVLSSETAKTMEEIVKEAKIQGSVYLHLTHMCRAGVVVRSGKTYKLASK